VIRRPEPYYVPYKRRMSFGSFLLRIFFTFAVIWGAVTLVRWVTGLRWIF
jgi:hypothetical protein